MHESHETGPACLYGVIGVEFYMGSTYSSQLHGIIDPDEEEVNKSGLHDGSSCIYCVTNNSSYSSLPVYLTVLHTVVYFFF